MQELSPCRKLTLLKPEGTRRVIEPKLGSLESFEEEVKNMGMRNWGRKCRTESSGGQFWKRLRFTKNSNVGRKR
jgi:hypothetical protein